MIFSGCSKSSPEKPKLNIKQVETNINVQSSGLSVEQEAIQKRLIEDNTPGTIKHLYVISEYSGQVLIYSTVKGKVTSSGKSNRPKTTNPELYSNWFPFYINGEKYGTYDVPHEDGTWGESNPPYIYWQDIKGIYHQHYISGGQIVHISSQPLAVKSVIINMELTTEK
jgi:hypothetical protein